MFVNATNQIEAKLLVATFIKGKCKGVCDFCIGLELSHGLGWDI